AETAFRLFAFRERLSRDRPKVRRDRPAIFLGETGGVLDDLIHRAANEIEIRGVPVGQHADDVVLVPIADAGLRIGRDVRHLLAAGLGRRASEKAVGIRDAEPAARRMAVAAAPDRGDEIAAAVPYLI